MIKELFETITLTPQEKNVVQYIQEHPECLLNINAKELAKLTYVSSPTIIRLSKKLGFTGYHDFQLTYVQEYMLHQKNLSSRLTKESSIDDVIQILPQIYDQVFHETKNMIQKEAFVRTINYMLQAKQIDFYANDNNYSEIQTIALKLNSIGIRAQVFNTINSVYLDHINPQETIAFVVSHSGSNKTMIDAAYALRKKRIRVVGVTGRLSQDLELICNENLYIDSYNHHLPHSIMLYGLSIHYIFDVLYTALYFKKIK